MYIKEMQIEARSSLQKIGSNRTRKLLDAEIDWFLNKNQERFIRSQVRPVIRDGHKAGGFEILQDNLDAIKMLIRRGVKIPAYIGDDRTVRAALPGDYAYLTQDESGIKRIASTTPLPTITTQTVYIHRFRLPPSTLTVAPYYKQVQMVFNNNTVFDINVFTADRNIVTWNGFSSPDEVFNLVNPLLRELVNQKYDAYWERYGDNIYPRSLLIVSSAAATGSITIDGVTTALTSTALKVQVKDAPGVLIEYQANRLTASNVSASLLEVAFFGTQPEFPISEMVNGYLYTYPNKTFIVTNSIISYIRKPRRMSLILGVDCELSEEYHQLICDMTVEYIKGMIADPNWEVKLKDNMERTTIDQ